MNDRPENKLLLCCARTDASVEIAEQIRKRAAAEVDWNYLARLARRHSIIPLLYRHRPTTRRTRHSRFQANRDIITPTKRGRQGKTALDAPQKQPDRLPDGLTYDRGTMHTGNGNGKSRLNAAHLQPLPLPNCITLRELLEANPQATQLPEEIIPKLGYRERVTLLAGREKRGKTRYAATAAAKLSAGGIHLGEQLTPHTVLWTIAEGHKNDVARIMIEANADPNNIHFPQALGAQRLTQLEINIASTQPAVVFIDTLASFTDDTITSASSSDHWIAILNRLQQLAEKHHCAIVVIAHNRKDDEEVRDSTAITAHVDMVLRMTDHPKNKNARRIKSKGQGRWDLADHTVILDGNEYRLHVEGEETAASAQATRAHKYLDQNPNASLYQTRKHVGGTNDITDEIHRSRKAANNRSR